MISSGYDDEVVAMVKHSLSKKGKLISIPLSNWKSSAAKKIVKTFYNDRKENPRFVIQISFPSSFNLDFLSVE